MKKLFHELRYWFGFGRPWTAGLPNATPNLDDPAIRTAIENGRTSITEHHARTATTPDPKPDHQPRHATN